MQELYNIDEFLRAMDDCGMDHHAVIDVRSPGEFASGHIPGALNVPLFDDEQRARIGTLYKQQGHDAAVLAGLGIAGPKMRWLVETCRQAPPAAVQGQRNPGDCKRPILLHCWRGGMRSNSVASVLQMAGMHVCVLRGGYKAFRRRAHEEFEAPRRMIVLSGMTGAGKTAALREIATLGEQVVDLEALAHHRGSSFGGIGLPPQPTTEQFENELFLQLRRLDRNRPTWLEDESPSIGKVRVPTEFWWNMRRSPAVFLDVDRTVRARNLVAEYGCLNAEQLLAATQRLQKKLGGLRTQQASTLLDSQDYQAVALLLLEYYDKTYGHAAEKRPRQHVYRLSGDITAERIVQFGRTLQLAKVS